MPAARAAPATTPRAASSPAREPDRDRGHRERPAGRRNDGDGDHGSEGAGERQRKVTVVGVEDRSEEGLHREGNQVGGKRADHAERDEPRVPRVAEAEPGCRQGAERRGEAAPDGERVGEQRAAQGRYRRGLREPDLGEDRDHGRVLECREHERTGETEHRPREVVEVGQVVVAEPDREKEGECRFDAPEDDLEGKQDERGPRDGRARAHAEPSASGTSARPMKRMPSLSAHASSAPMRSMIRRASSSVAAYGLAPATTSTLWNIALSTTGAPGRAARASAIASLRDVYERRALGPGGAQPSLLDEPSDDRHAGEGAGHDGDRDFEQGARTAASRGSRDRGGRAAWVPERRTARPIRHSSRRAGSRSIRPCSPDPRGSRACSRRSRSGQPGSSLACGPARSGTHP